MGGGGGAEPDDTIEVQGVHLLRRKVEDLDEEAYVAYLADLARAGGDPVAPMLERIEATLERFRIYFDSWTLQSELETRFPDFLPRLDSYEREGAVWARSSAYGDEEDRVLIRSPEQGGTPTYRAADVVYLADKLDRGFDRAIYVLGADHHGTRNWYAAVAASNAVGLVVDSALFLLIAFGSLQFIAGPDRRQVRSNPAVPRG